MAGHNKWSKIKRKKGVADAKRGAIFSRIIKEINISIKEGGSQDPDFNPRLRMALSNAKGANMPKDNIDRAIKKAVESGTESYHQPTYEGYASGGVAVFIECATDNLNRTVAAVRAAFNKREGSLSTSGSVDYLFERKGIFIINTKIEDKEFFELELIDGGAEDIDYDDDSNEVTLTVGFEDFGNMQKKLEELGLEPKSSTLERIPLNTMQLNVHEAKKALGLIEVLEELEDVQNVFHNLEMTEELEAALQ